MIAPVISMVLALLAGFVVAMGWSALRAAFGKDNRTIVLIALLAATTLSGLAAEILIHHPSFGVMFLMSSAAFINYQEVRAEGTRLDALTALFRQSVASALATRVSETIEIDVTNAPDSVLEELIQENQERGLIAVTIKNHLSKEVILRLSDFQYHSH